MRLVLLISLWLSLQAIQAATEQPYYIAFDLDETLIASDRMLDKDIEAAKELGYIIETSKKGQKYIVRPGAVEILEFAQSQGFPLIILTHNTRNYAEDILGSSGLEKYFEKVKSNEDMNLAFQKDFKTYPNHRNKVYKNKTGFWTNSTKSLYRGLVKRGFQRLAGNSNIHAYLPCYNCDKYPPVFGARILIDNSNYNVEDSLDYVGIKVEEFTGLQKQANTPNGHLVWVEELKQDIEYAKNQGWAALYHNLYQKNPPLEEVPIQD